jgi:hypothetical protein
MSDQVIHNKKFYDLNDHELIFSKGSHAYGDFDGYLGHESIKIWFLGDDLFCYRMYEEKPSETFICRMMGLYKHREYGHAKLTKFYDGEGMFHILGGLMDSGQARNIIENYWKKSKPKKQRKIR